MELNLISLIRKEEIYLEQLLPSNFDSCNLSPLTLAFIGDAVFDLMIREMIAKEKQKSIGELNKIKINLVNCRSQSAIVSKIIDFLTDEELCIYKWGRNAHVNHMPHNASPVDYHRATGLEVLLGYLYINKNINRMKEIISIAI